MNLSRDIFVGALIALVFAGATSISAEGGPRAEVRPRIWDFGYLPQKSEVSHQFYLCNIGTAPLTVTKIKPGCACTSVSKIDTAIAPGDSAAILVTFKSGRYRRKTRMTTKIHTNDPKTPVHDLRVFSYIVKRGEEVGEVSVLPQKLTWRVDKKRIVAGADTLKMANNGEDSLTVTIRYAPDWLAKRIVFPQGKTMGPRAKLLVYLAGGPLPDEIDSPSLTLAFTGRDTTLVTVPIKIED